MKKLLSFFLSIALLSTLSFTAYATEVAPSVPQEHAIPSIPEEISFSHNRIIKGFTCSASNNLRVMNEYEILQSASAKAMPNSYKKVMERIQSPKSEMEQLLN